MKRFCLLIAVLMFGGSMPTYAEQPAGACIEFSEKVIELGELSQQDDKLYLRISYSNVGDLPLVVMDVRTSCSCTEVQFDRSKVLPGERGVINVTMNPSKAPVGSFYRVLQVVSNSTRGVERITLKAEISE